jgi:hypothetical protein
MIFNWYKLFNKAEFLSDGLVSRTLTLNLEGLGQKEVHVTFGNLLSITYEGVFLSLDLNDKNPFYFEGHSVYLDADDDVWLGIEVPEED